MSAIPAAELAAVPSRTVTFLFTDIEGSTALWDRFPDAMRLALARHDSLLRRAIESSNGHVVKTTGDGVYAVFDAATDALSACVAAQRALQHRDDGAVMPETLSASAESAIVLKVRMGLHTGAGELRGGDYFGLSVNRAARIMSVAHGEQVLLSTATANSLSGHLPDGITLRDVGQHRLKGLPTPERLLQVVAADLRSEFPPLASLTGHNLPAERDAFVGRHQALDELSRRLDAGARLVSVIGVGGMGKTRLVMRFGWNSLGAYPGGVWFCDLSQARTQDGIVHATAQGLDVPLGSDDPVTQIGNAIAARGRCLVIVDNFEQVARHADDTLGRWLDRAADARFIVTTREVLGLPGEEILGLAPLAAADAVALFVRRAEAARPGFEPSADDRSVIAALIKLLEGLPLAIELAAARLRVMSPKMLLARMSERFKLLSSTGGRVDRQATLRAVFDWSWDLLSMPEKAALAQLSVFEGGFTLESVEAVVDLSAHDAAPDPLDVVQSLLQKSFVRQLSDDRFDLLVSVQEYAAGHLRTAGSYGESGPAATLAAEIRHGAYFANLDEQAATADACAELDNLVVACRRAVARRDPDMAARTLEGAWAALALRGPFSAGVELAALVQTIPDLRGAAAANVHRLFGTASAAIGKIADAHEQLEASLVRAREVADRRCECQALIRLGYLDFNTGRLESAGARFETALIVAREANEPTSIGDAHNGLGNLQMSLGRTSEARRHFEAALERARQAGDRHRECSVLGNLASLCTDCGLMDESRSHHEAALALVREDGNRKLEGSSLCNLGLLHYIEGQLDDALDRLEAALALGRDLGSVRLACVAACNLAMVCDRLGRFDEARHHFDSALAVARELEDRRLEGQCLSYLGLLHAHQSNLEEARRSFDRSETLLRAVSDQISLGILFCNRAETEYLDGASDAARTSLTAAESLAEASAVAPASELGVALARLRNLVCPPIARASPSERV